MKSDLDSIMQANQIDALMVTGPGDHNPAMVYLLGAEANLTQADLIKRRGQGPVLFHADMERDEAARTGLATRNMADFGLAEIYQAARGDLLEYQILRYEKMLANQGLTTGRVALYGRMEAGQALAVFGELERRMPGLQFVPEAGNTVLMQAMATKDEVEVGRMRRMGQATTEVVGKTAEFLTSQAIRDGVLVLADGQPVTIGMVKRKINLWLAEAGVENPEGVIFASGYDAAVPHSSGTASQPLRLGETIIFDIFPCEAGGGYFFDFTRTWCLGHAPEAAWTLYETVRMVYETILSELRAGAPTRQYMLRACELFEGRGFPTPRSHPQTQTGFVHGLGHSLGLNIHEQPQFGLFANENDRLLPGMVMTVEPGLYDPVRQVGVRLEDTVWMRPDGQVEILAEYPLDLVLPIKNRQVER
jgi:Xaa-Pro aminopeptidase